MQVPSKMDANLASNDKSPEELFSVEQKIIKKIMQSKYLSYSFDVVLQSPDMSIKSIWT